MDEPAYEVECRTCGAAVGEPCDQPLPHLERRDEAGDPGPFGVFDLDGDGVVGAFDPDDPGFWLCLGAVSGDVADGGTAALRA